MQKEFTYSPNRQTTNIDSIKSKGKTKEMAIESAQTKAERLMVEFCPDQVEFKKLTARNRSHERVDLLRQAISILLINAIPTAVIGKVLKVGQGAVQYHARWLEKNGKIVKPSRFAHWIGVREA